MLQEKGEIEKIQVPKSKEKLNRSNKEICEDYLRSQNHFQIYYENRLLFDSRESDRSNVYFLDKTFSVYGRLFPYKGMTIKMKK